MNAGINFVLRHKRFISQNPLANIKDNRAMDFFLCVLGMVMIVEGLPYFLAPQKMKQWIRTMLDMPETYLRKLGLAVMLAGLFLVYLGKR
jgi:uncharacterized protein